MIKSVVTPINLFGVRKFFCLLCMLFFALGLTGCGDGSNVKTANRSSAKSTVQIAPATTYLVITFNWYDSSGTQIGDTLTQFKNNQLPYQFSKGEFIRENYGNVVFTGYVETIEHNIQFVSHLDEWQHDMTIKMKDSTRVE